MTLLEREGPLDVLARLFEDAGGGQGRVVLVRGEAGIGKTSLIRHFVSALDGGHVLWGGCDDLMAARPFGPVWDMALDEPDLAAALDSGDRQEAFGAVLELLSRSLRPTVMVIEDVHWADDATLDLVKFVGRRMDRTHGLLILTYRDGEVQGDHPLRVALGDLPHGVVERLPLQPLSEAGVQALAGEGADSHALWEVTGGNPFFVSEAIATGGEGVPLSIRDAVNARVQRLSRDARALVELTSVAPSKIQLAVVEDILGDASVAIAECEEAGILELGTDSLRFRHELARRAVEGELPSITRRRLNLACLNAAERLGFDLSLRAHHAREAEDAESIVRILPMAARRASEVESHAEALATLRALEPYLELMGREELADHYDLWAYEEYLRSDQGLELIERGIDLRRELGDPAALSNTLLIASRIAWVGTNRGLAIEYAEEAAAAAEPLGGEDLAMVYSVLSQLAMLGGYEDETVAWGERALALIGPEDNPIRAHALNNIGAVRMIIDLEDGLAELVESRRISAALNLIHDETRACVNIAWNYLVHYRLDEARRWIDEALAVVGDAEMPSFESYAQAERAWWHEMRGEWGRAEALATSLYERDDSLKTAQTVASALLARIAIRRGSARPRDLVAEAVARAETTEEAQRLGPAYAVLAEWAWLGGDVGDEEIERAVEVMHWCFDHLNRFSAGEIGQWLAAMGVIDEVPGGAPEPFRLLVDGDWRGAADWWGERSIPYERAVALAHGDVTARLEALSLADDLGAVPLATRLRGELQAEGVRGVPRAPQRATRDNPLGLTPRQNDVLRLLTQDMTNPEIADRLFISTRTVDHHVSAILAKLGASNRSEAAEMARSVLAPA